MTSVVCVCNCGLPLSGLLVFVAVTHFHRPPWSSHLWRQTPANIFLSMCSLRSPRYLSLPEALSRWRLSPGLRFLCLNFIAGASHARPLELLSWNSTCELSATRVPLENLDEKQRLFANEENNLFTCACRKAAFEKKKSTNNTTNKSAGNGYYQIVNKSPKMLIVFIKK